MSLGFYDYAVLAWPVESHFNEEETFLWPATDKAVEEFPWEINIGVGATCCWEHVPTEIRWVQSGELSCAAVVVGPHEDILRASLRIGMFLTVNQLTLIMRTLEIPTPTVGSGDKGQVWKTDLINAMLADLFPDEDKSLLDHMHGCLMGSKNWSDDQDDHIDLLPGVPRHYF